MLVGNLSGETPELPKPAPSESGCPQCLEAELHCFSCDDPICNDHIRTFEKYASVFSPELGAALIENHGNRIYCPLCFKAVFNRFSHEVSRPTPKKEKTFNLPIVLGLVTLVMIIILGVQRCDASSDLLAKGTAIGFEDRTR